MNYTPYIPSVEEQNQQIVNSQMNATDYTVNADDKKVFVEGMYFQTEGEELGQHFEQNVEIEQTIIEMDQLINRKNVDMQKAEERKCKIFVRTDLFNDEIKSHFAQFQNIVEGQMRWDKMENQRTGFSSITLKSNNVLEDYTVNAGDKKIFVEGMHFQTEDEGLGQPFEQNGEIEQLIMKMDQLINGKKVDTQKAEERKCKIFVRTDLLNDDIVSHFTQFQNIVKGQVPCDKMENLRKGLSSITLESNNVLEDYIVNADDKKVFVEGMHFQTEDEELGQPFEQNGEIEKIIIKMDNLINVKKVDMQKAGERRCKIFIRTDLFNDDIMSHFTHFQNILEGQVPCDKMENLRKGLSSITLESDNVLEDLSRIPQIKINGNVFSSNSIQGVSNGSRFVQSMERRSVLSGRVAMRGCDCKGLNRKYDTPNLNYASSQLFINVDGLKQRPTQTDRGTFESRGVFRSASYGGRYQPYWIR